MYGFSIFIFYIFYIFNMFVVFRQYNIVYALMHPINFLSIYLAVFFIIPISLGSFYSPDSIEYFDSDKYLTNTLLLVVFTYVVVSVVNIFFLNKKIDRLHKPSNIKYGHSLEFYISLYLLFLLTILSYLIWKMGGVGVFNNIAEFTIKARNGNTLLLMIIYTVEIIPIFYLLVSQRVNKFFLAVITIIAMLFVSIVGARTLVLSIVIGLILVLLRRKEINFLKSFKIFALCILFFVLASAIRNSGEDSKFLSFQERVDLLLIYWSNNSDQLFTTLYVMKKIDNHELDYQFGGTIVDVMYFFIPGALWENKPKSFYPSRLVYRDIISSGIENNTKLTINFGMIARPYLDFGILGIVVLNLILYLFLLKRYVYLISSTKKQKNVKILQNIYIYSHIHQIYILGIWSHVLAIIIFNMIMIYLIYHGYLNFRKLVVR